MLSVSVIPTSTVVLSGHTVLHPDNPNPNNIKKVNFGSKTMSIKKHIPARKRSFMARMGGVLKKVRGQKSLSPAYWAIRSWR